MLVKEILEKSMGQTFFTYLIIFVLSIYLLPNFYPKLDEQKLLPISHLLFINLLRMIYESTSPHPRLILA